MIPFVAGTFLNMFQPPSKIQPACVVSMHVLTATKYRIATVVTLAIIVGVVQPLPSYILS
jgi:hypothetical protein